MSDFVQLVANVAAVVPATTEVVYDKYWMKSLRIVAENPTKEVRLVAELAPARDVNGVKEIMPNKVERIVVNDIFAEAANNASFATVINNVLTQIQLIGVAQGILK